MAHGAGAQTRVIAGFDNFCAGSRRRKFDRNFLIGKGFVDIGHHEVHDLAKFGLIERAEQDDFVKTIEQFRLELAAVD